MDTNETADSDVETTETTAPETTPSAVRGGRFVTTRAIVAGLATAMVLGISAGYTFADKGDLVPAEGRRRFEDASGRAEDGMQTFGPGDHGDERGGRKQFGRGNPYPSAPGGMAPAEPSSGGGNTQNSSGSH